jgi:hypothetical protein
MKIDDTMKFSGEVSCFVFNGEIDFGDQNLTEFIDTRTAPAWDQLVSEFHTPNLVTTVGRGQMTKIIVGETTLLCGYCALSTSTITPAIADTTLPSEKIRQAVSTRQSVSSLTQRYLTYFTTVSFGSTAIASEGLFDATSSGGNMWADATVSISKSTTQSLLIDHKILATT